MQTRLKFKFAAAALVASLAFSLLHTTAVIADDETPPPVETPVETPPVEELSEDPVQNSETIAPLLEQVPPQTEVVVVVEGEIQPLATQSAANAFVAGDPIWCPEGDAPTPGAGDCTASYPNLLALVEAIDDGSLVLPAADGVIWITGGNDSSSADISIDGSNARFATLSNYALTIQGGWGGVSGDSSAPGTSVFSVPVSITNWNAAVTINQITVNSSTYSTPSIGLEVQTSGDVFLNSISTLENGDVGLSVEAGGDIEAGNLTSERNAASGAEFSALGGVTLFGVNSFLDNHGEGIVVEAAGDIDFENVNSSGNLIGADLISTGGGVTLSGINSFTLNHDTGLYVEAAGDIDLQNVTANQNDSSGAVLYSSSGVALGGVNAFDQNGDNGLLAEASADIDIDSVSFSASGNGGSGASLVSLLQSVSLVGGSNVFDGNTLEGLYVEAFRDATLENIAASNNASGAEVNLGGDFLMTGTNVFNSNRGAGLYVGAGGEIDAENITANQNGLISGFGGGAELYALGAVSLGGSNVFDENQDSGLLVDAGGNVEAENVGASGNGASGAEIFTPGAFTLLGTNVFNNNAQDGLFVDAGGFVFIENITARFNGGDGVFIEGSGSALVSCGLTTDNAVYQIEADLPGALTLAGVDFGGDIDHNLGVDEDRLILVSNGCFHYPVIVDDDEEDGDDEEGFVDQGFTPLPEPLLPIQVVEANDGQVARLDCRLYRGTLLKTPNGNAYIPCPIDDAARLLAIPPYALPGALPDGLKYLSSLHLAITKGGVMYKPPSVPGSVWYVDASTSVRNVGSRVIYWDGSDWNDITEEVTPFISILFPIPPELQGKNLAILYWDGMDWVELTDNQFFGDGRVTHAGGFMDNGFFTAIVNFVGTFVLVEK